MKKICFVIILWMPFLLHSQPVLDILKINPSQQSQDFVTNKKQFQLHDLITEQRHPNTWNLSEIIQSNTQEGIQSLLSVDRDICEVVREFSKNTTSLDLASNSVKNAILQKKKIYIYGCGATGRLAKQMESSFWRPFWKKMKSLPQWERLKDYFPNIENRLIGEMTGGDRALISSLEGFEDLQLIGKLQLDDRHIEKGDVVFAITEGGETSSVIGTILAALKQYNDSDEIVDKQSHLYFIYNNPDHVLLPFERSRSVIENTVITKICLSTGPQSITGSTRMQATTSETFVMGIILEQAIYELLQTHLSESDLEYLGFHSTNMYERLLSFLPLQQAVENIQAPISQFTDLEASTYRNEAFSTYFAKDALITVFIDSTERAPTFRLFPIDIFDVEKRKSWIQVWTPATNKVTAWENFLGRPFYGLDKGIYEEPFSQEIEDVYLKMAALRSLTNAGDDQQFLYDFSYSPANVEAHGPNDHDLGVMVLFANEIEQLVSQPEPFQQWLKTFVEKKAKIAVILMPPSLLDSEDSAIQIIKSIDREAFVLQLPLDNAQDPLKIRQHVGLKMLLNAHSTGVMAKLGRVVGNTMTNVNPGNLKLIGRATFLILSHVNDKLSPEDKISYADANAVLFDAIEYGKRMQKTGQNAEVGMSVIRILEALKSDIFISWEEAEDILQHQGLESYLKKFAPMPQFYYMDKQMMLNNQSKEEIAFSLREIISPNPFMISAGQVEEISKRYELKIEELLQMLIPIAQSYARPPVSNYKVGAAALGKSGNIYLGVNLEFLGVPLNEAIHGEQFVITNARSHGETEIIAIALSAAPCGHCRQFLNEMAGSENLRILTPFSDSLLLSSLLPHSFSPKDLGLTGNLMTIMKDDSLLLNGDVPLMAKAAEAASASYAPYTESKSGVAIQLKDGKIYSGSYLENVAFNPSISPLQAALILLVADERQYSEISEVVLVEKQSAKISQEIMSREILSKIAPQAVFKVKKLK